MYSRQVVGLLCTLHARVGVCLPLPRSAGLAAIHEGHIQCLSAVRSARSTTHKSLSSGYVVTKSIMPIMQIRWMVDVRGENDCLGATSFSPCRRNKEALRKVDKGSEARTLCVRLGLSVLRLSWQLVQTTYSHSTMFE